MSIILNEQAHIG